MFRFIIILASMILMGAVFRADLFVVIIATTLFYAATARILNHLSVHKHHTHFYAIPAVLAFAIAMAAPLIGVWKAMFVVAAVLAVTEGWLLYERVFRATFIKQPWHELPVFEEKITEILHAAGIKEPKLEVPANTTFGDFAFPCFSLAKEWKKAPQEIAKELVHKLKPTKWVSAIAAHGPYVNFVLNKTKVAEEVLVLVRKQKHKYGTNKEGKGKKVMIEFSSPNTNKPMHLGHVRNNALGRAISNLFAANGYKVLRANLINDRGVHICKAMLAYERWAKGQTPEKAGKKGDHFIGDLYVKFSQEAGKNPELETEALALLYKWEAGEKKTIALWKKMRKWCLDGFKQTYKEMDIDFDKYYYESEIWKGGKELVEEGLKKGVFVREPDGAVKAVLQPHGIPDKIIVRKEGTTLYVTQDMYLAKLRFEQHKLDQLIYVVASEQDLHFQQLFKILDLLGYEWAGKCHHFSYGLVSLPSGVLKSRTGQVVDADDIMREMQHLAQEEIHQRAKDLPEQEVAKRSKIVGLGALTFHMLKIDPVKELFYDPKESIKFEGETGPYVQYTHARICSIFEKHGKGVGQLKNPALLTHANEQKIITLLADYPAVVSASALRYDVYSLAQYLMMLATAMNSFYTSCPVLNAETPELRDARLALLDGVRQVIKNGLNLLGIDAPERM